MATTNLKLNSKPKRILIKISGEGLAGKSRNLSIDNQIVISIAKQIKIIKEGGNEVAIVVGGGNFWRGSTAAKLGIERNKADYIGMLATVMNGLALLSALEAVGVKTKVFSSLNVDTKICSLFSLSGVLKSFQEGEVVVLVGGTGRPFFSTDTATSLFASEIKADLILMGKNGVDGVYNSDPLATKDARRYCEISYNELITRNLRIMDLSCAAMLKASDIETLVFNVSDKDAFVRVIEGEIRSTKISNRVICKEG